MAKVENAYNCDCCHQLFRYGDTYAQEPKGVEFKLMVGSRYGGSDSPKWTFNHVCDPCRAKLIEAIKAVAGEPTDAAKPEEA